MPCQDMPPEQQSVSGDQDMPQEHQPASEYPAPGGGGPAWTFPSQSRVWSIMTLDTVKSRFRYQQPRIYGQFIEFVKTSK